MRWRGGGAQWEEPGLHPREGLRGRGQSRVKSAAPSGLAGLGLGDISATLEEETVCAGSTLPACEVMDL